VHPLALGPDFGQAGLVAHLPHDPHRIGVGNNGAALGKDQQPGIRPLRQRQGRREQALRLQAQHACHHAQQGAVAAVQGHGQHDAGVVHPTLQQLRDMRFAIAQGALQGLPHLGFHLSVALKPSLVQVHAHLAVHTRHQHGVKELHGGQPVLQQPFQRGGQIHHVGGDAGRHGAQHLLALLDLARQQPGKHLDFVVLLRLQALDEVVTRGTRHQPACGPGRQAQREQGRQHRAQHHGASSTRPGTASSMGRLPCARGPAA
jgi:hypothetical protein